MADGTNHGCNSIYRTVVESQDELICRFLPDKTITFVNDAYCRFFGKTRDELIGKSFMSLIPENDHAGVEEHFLSINKSSPFAVHEHRVIAPNGEIRWQQWSNRAIFDNYGVLTEYQSVGRDITERKHIMETLEEKEEEYRTILSATTDGFWEADTQGWFLEVNTAFSSLTEYRREELLTMSLHDIEEGRNFDEVISRIQHTIEAGAYRYETSYRKKGGGIVIVEVSINYHYFNKKGGRFFAFVRDITDRKQTEESLAENEATFRLLFESSADPILLYNGDHFTDCNTAALTIMHSTSKEQIIGKSLSDISPKKQSDGKTSPSKERSLVAAAFKNGNTRFEWVCTAMNGSEFWVDMSLTAVQIMGKTVIYMVWRDLTAQRIMLEKIKESEEKIRIFGMSDQDGVLLMDNEGKITYINQAAENIIGYTVQEALGKTLDEFLHPRDFFDAQKLQIGIAEAVPFLVTQDASAVPKGKALEISATKKLGTEVDIELSLLSEMSGNQWRIIGIFRDVSEQKKAVEALKKSEEKYRRLFEETKDAVFISTPDGRLIDANHAAVKLFRYDSKEELLGINVARDLYTNAEDRADFKKAMLLHGFVYMHELTFKRKDGEKVIVAVTANATYDNEGNITGYQGIMHDLTEIKKLERQVLEFHKLEAVGRLIGNLAHHFNNILSIIVGSAQLAKIHLTDTSMVMKHLSSIEAEVFRAADVVDHLLTFGRRSELAVKIVNINDIVKDFLKVVKDIIGENIEIRTTLHYGIARARVDEARINQVLLNLVTNARNAMGGKGILIIETSLIELADSHYESHIGIKPGRYVLISVTDTGCGIDDVTKARVFEPFFTTAGEEGQKGLGLSVAYGIVKQHGGFIHIESTPGTGSVFKIFLPAAIERERTDTITQDAIPGGTETILVAEDERALRDIASKMLTALGYTALLAADGMEALEIFRSKSEDIDLVMLDIVMPKMHGSEVYKEIRKIKPSIPVIFVTGYNLAETQMDFVAEEGFEAIQKPYMIATLGDKLRKILDSSKTGPEGHGSFKAG